MGEPSQIYNIWADGSYRGDTVGAAWQILYADQSRAGHKTVSDLHRNDRPRGSDIAELIAVKGALETIPSGAHVHLRLDAQNIIDMLRSGNVAKASKSVPDGLKAAFDNAYAQVGRFEKCEITKVSDKTNTNMQEVNRQARAASGRESRESARDLRHS